MATPTLLRRGRTFELWRGRDGACVTPIDARSDRARERLRQVAAAHEAARHPHLAQLRSVDLDADVPSLTFDVDAVADGEEVVARLSARGPLPFDAAIGFIDAYGRAVAAAHATRHPLTNSPCCFGAVGWGAFLFDARGRFVLVGLGAPLLLESRPPSPGAFVAPEVGAGAPPSPGGDVLAFAMLHRSALGLVALPTRLSGALFALASATDLTLAAQLASVNHRLFVGSPDQRPGADEMLALLHRTWKRLGAQPDLGHHESLVADLLATSTERSLRVGEGAAYFEIGGGPRVSLARRAPLRRVLAALVEARRLTPDRPLSTGELMLAGWPGERILADAGASRVYVALSTLRRMGLCDVIERFEDGYRIAPSVELRP